MEGTQDTSNTFAMPPQMQNQGQSLPPSPQSSAPQPQPVVTPPPKSGLPKVAIFAVAALLILIIIVVIFKILTSPATSTKTTGNITWWGLWEDQNNVQPLISAYEAAHKGVKVTYVQQSPQDYRERLTSALASFRSVFRSRSFRAIRLPARRFRET